jgi:hypothetical protein
MGAHPAVICGDVYDREFDDEDADRDRIGKEKILLLTQVKASALDCATAPAQSSSARAPRV